MILKPAYTRCETDAEFGERLRKTYPWYRGDTYYKGAELDDEVYDAFKLQRKIIEVFP